MFSKIAGKTLNSRITIKMENVFMNDIDRLSELCKQGHYDVIVIGSGLAGGTVTRRLLENNKKVLLIEKGGVEFSTHCLNTSRPHWQINSLSGPSQDNDVVYQTVKQKVQTSAGSDPYAGGPVYCLGGRSTVWGLYSPRISKEKQQHFFHPEVIKYLEKEGYDRALSLFTNQSQSYDRLHPEGVVARVELDEAKKKLNEAIHQLYNNWGIHYPQSTRFAHANLAPMAAEF